MTAPQSVPVVELLFEIHPPDDESSEGASSTMRPSEVAFEELRRQLDWPHSNLSFQLRDRLQDNLVKKQRADSSATSGTDESTMSYQKPSLARFMDASTTATFDKPSVLGLKEQPVHCGKAFFVETSFPSFGIDRGEGATQAPPGHPFGQPPLYEPYEANRSKELDATQQKFEGGRRFRCIRYE
eukprot:gnl/MRDRNA2_/MRDRNA2_32510_c0_seq1.p1 gnl/MRDRNA2_/MRDRNA2_32510_c0~~gnl/MRDRNA2_/MRDRNA2_32510_c0_seq1.p1  ORF type:complete len:196 (-),score=34.67 gnl/MRDRNA2_/MRDRNA2_32510_c0_seq1:22-573(-)